VWLGVEAVVNFSGTECVLLSTAVQRNVRQMLCSNRGHEQAILTKVIRDIPQSLQYFKVGHGHISLVLSNSLFTDLSAIRRCIEFVGEERY
jgi:hypothetical protein